MLLLKKLLIKREIKVKVKSLFALGLFALSKCDANHKNNDDYFFLDDDETSEIDDVHKLFASYQPKSDIEFLDDKVIEKSQAQTSFFETEEDDDVVRKSRYGSTMFERDDDEDFSFKVRGSETKMRFNNG